MTPLTQPAPPPLRVLLAELVRHHELTVITTPGDAALQDGAPLDAITVLQFDGDAVTRIANLQRAPEHLAKLRTTAAQLARLRGRILAVERLRWLLTLSAQLPLLKDLIGWLSEPPSTQALSAGLAVSAAGALLHVLTPKAMGAALRAWARSAQTEAFSGRSAAP